MKKILCLLFTIIYITVSVSAGVYADEPAVMALSGIPQVEWAYIEGNGVVGSDARLVMSYTGPLDEANTLYNWYIMKNEKQYDKQNAAAVSTTKSVTLTSDMAGYFLMCEITPKNASGQSGTKAYSTYFGKIYAPDASVGIKPAETVGIVASSAEIGGTLKGIYTYINTKGIPEGASGYQWYRSEKRGEDYTAIPGANGRTYTLTEEDKNCYIKFAVTARDAMGNTAAEVQSTGKVTVGDLAFRKNPAYTDTYGDRLPGYGQVFNATRPERHIFFGYESGVYSQTNTGYGSTEKPYYLAVDLGSSKFFNTVEFKAYIRNYTSCELYATDDKSDWGSPIAGTFSADGQQRTFSLNRPGKARYVMIKFCASSANHNIFRMEVLLKNPDTIPPVVTLVKSDANPVKIPKGYTYVDAGATATDNLEGDIPVSSSGSVDTNTVGEYIITYTATDGYGNTGTATRTVIVQPGVQKTGDEAFEKPIIDAAAESDASKRPDMVDGNTYTKWFTDSVSSDASFTVDLGESMYISRSVFERTGTASSYSIYGSNDGSAWTKIFDGAGESTREFDYVKYRYWKCSFSKSGQVAVADFELYFSDKGRAEYAADRLSITTEELSSDLALLKTDALDSKIKISWTSSDTSVITNDGSIVSWGGEAVLTATVTCGTATAARSFTVKTESKSGGSSGFSGGGGGGGGSYTPNKTEIPDNTIIAPVQPSQGQGSASFGDVPSGHWAKGYIEKLSSLGIVSGKGNGNYEPEQGVTREELVKMIVETAGISSDETATDFGDVDSSQWYAGYIAAAVKSGIISGISADEFGVGRVVSRQDMCVILYRAIELIRPGSFNDIAKGEFADGDQIDDYAKDAVAALKSIELVNGMGDNMFYPKDGVTRAQVAKVLCMMIEQVVGR